MLLDRYLTHFAKRDIDTKLYQSIATATLADDMIASGANPDAPAFNDINDDFYPIHRAAMNPDIEVLKYIVSLGVNPCRYDFWARQPLAFAVRQNTVDFAKYLVGLGNEADYVDDDGGSVIAEAALNPHIDVLDFLLEQGADIQAGGMGALPLEIAVTKGDVARVKYFIDHGAEIDCIDELDAFCAPLQNLRFILELGYDANTIDDFGDSRVIDHLDPKRQALFKEFGGEILNPNAEKYYLTYPESMPEDEQAT